MRIACAANSFSSSTGRPAEPAPTGGAADPLAVERLLRALADELPPARAARVAAAATGLPRDTLYERIRTLKGAER